MRGHWFVLGCLGLLACEFPELPPVEEDAALGHRVGGTIAGLWTGASLEVRVSAAGEQLGTATVSEEGPFDLAPPITAGTTVDVEVALEPDRHDCSVINGTQRLVTADIDDIEIRCTTDIAVDVRVLSPLTFDFDPQITRHQLEVSVLQTEIALSVTAPATATVQVAGRPAAIGVATSPVVLPFGLSDVPVDISIDGLSRRYVVEVDRGTSAVEEYRYLKASNADGGDFFAEAVAGDLDRVVVGAPGEDAGNNAFPFAGALYVYRRSGTTWTQEGFLQAPPVAMNRVLGASVAIDGDVIVGGAHGSGIAGAAYVFERQDGSWQPPQRLVSPQSSTSDWFGFAVGVSGGTIAISDVNANAVYIYSLDGVSWTLAATVTSTDSVAGDQFGHRIALAGDRLAVAAPGESSGATGVSTMPATGTGAMSSGAVYLFRREGAGWTFEAFLKASTAVANGRFGHDIAFDGDQLAVGSGTREDVHVFRRAADTWSQEDVIRPTGATQGFGAAVAIREDVAAIGEPSALLVRLFRRRGSSWVAAGELTASNAEPGDLFGSSLRLLGDGLLSSAPNEASGGAPSDNSAPYAGAAYVIR